MAHKVLIIETDALVTPVMNAGELEPYSNPQLIAMYRAATGRETKKFATRQKAVQQTWAAIQVLAAVDLRATPPAPYQVGDALPEVVRTPAASGSIPPELARTEGGVDPAPSEQVTEQVIPATRAAGKVGRPSLNTSTWKSRKLKDGTYEFNMEARAPRGKTMGGRRPELVELLRRRLTFKQLLARYKPAGETEEQRAFNLATAMTCMGHVAGYGFRTAPDGRIDLLEPLA